MEEHRHVRQFPAIIVIHCLICKCREVEETPITAILKEEKLGNLAPTYIR